MNDTKITCSINAVIEHSVTGTLELTQEQLDLLNNHVLNTGVPEEGNISIEFDELLNDPKSKEEIELIKVLLEHFKQPTAIRRISQLTNVIIEK